MPEAAQEWLGMCKPFLVRDTEMNQIDSCSARHWGKQGCAVSHAAQLKLDIVNIFLHACYTQVIAEAVVLAIDLPGSF